MKHFTRMMGVALAMAASSGAAVAADSKSKFYDFSDQLIDGEIKKPTTLYSNVRGEAKFSRMLELKKELLPNVQTSRRERVFK
jgi:hypothetical protein